MKAAAVWNNVAANKCVHEYKVRTKTFSVLGAAVGMTGRKYRIYRSNNRILCMKQVGNIGKYKADIMKADSPHGSIGR